MAGVNQPPFYVTCVETGALWLAEGLKKADFPADGHIDYAHFGRETATPDCPHKNHCPQNAAHMEIAMKRLMTTTLAVATTLATLSAQADPVYHPPGSNLTYGAVSNGQSIMSDITNPAAGAAVLKKDGNQYRFGILSSIGVGVEFGDVDNLYNDIDTLSNLYDVTGLTITNTSTPATIAAEVDAAIKNANTVMKSIATNGYVKGFGTVHLPVMPLVIANKGLGGSLVLDVNGSVEFKALALQEDIQFDPSLVTNAAVQTVGDVTIDTSVPSFTVSNDTSVVTKAARTVELALGYSRAMMQTDDATFYAGLRGRYYKVGLSRVVQRMFAVTDSQALFDNATDANFNSDSGFGLDAGVLWTSKHYRLGATLANINEPSFEYDAVNFASFDDPTGSVAQQLRNDKTYTMEKQLSVEAALYTASQNWVISGGFDANAVKDALGDEYQWATVSAAYATDTWWLPGVRAGIRKNLAGSEINYFTFGATIAMLNLDLAWSSDKVTIDGNTVPRGAMFNLGLDVTF